LEKQLLLAQFKTKQLLEASPVAHLWNHAVYAEKLATPPTAPKIFVGENLSPQRLHSSLKGIKPL
jgi:hypothetical protein